MAAGRNAGREVVLGTPSWIEPDGLKIIGFDADMMQALGGEMVFMQELAHAGRIAQGLLVARRKA